MVIRGPFSVPIPQPQPFHSMVMDTFREYGDEMVALREEDSSKSLTFGQLRDYSYSLANALSSDRRFGGFRNGDVVVSFLENRIEFPLVFLGVSSLGGVTSGANPLYTPEELAKQIADSDARFLVTSEPLFAKVRKALELLKGSPSLKISCVFVIDASAQTASITSINGRIPMLPFDQLLSFKSSTTAALRRDRPPHPPAATIDPKQDPVMLPYSSGTTGLPKGVLLTHHNLQCLLFQRNSLGALQAIRRGDVPVLFLPFFHMAGFMALIWSMHHGATGIIMRQFDMTKYLGAVQRHKVTTLFVVPSVLVFLAKDPSVERYDLSSVKTILFGAAPAGKELIEAVARRFKNLEAVMQGYGLTESGGLATVTPPMPLSQYPFGSCGIPTPFTELKIVSIDGKNEELGPMLSGEILLRGPNVMKGYYKKPEATRETVNADGWLRTGDIGYYDFLGHLYVIDRLKELIKYKSYQVAPAELEDVILKHPAVQEVAVVGIPDKANPDLGELPTAYVVLKQGHIASDVTAINIKRTVSDHLAPFKHIRGGVVFVEQLPKGGTGKILRRVVKETRGKVYASESANRQKSKL